MVIKPADVVALLQQLLEGIAVAVERNVENGDLAITSFPDALQQLNITLHSGDEFRFRRFRKPELVQGAQSIGITVEAVDWIHVKTTGVNGGKDERQLVINTTCRTKNTTKSTTPLIISVGTSRSKPFLENLEGF